MEAMISGRAGLALVMDGGRLASIHAGEPERTVSRHPGEFHHLAGDVRDFINVEVETRDDVVRELLLAQDREDALQLVLIAQDPELSDGVRREAIEELEELLRNDDVVASVEAVLYSHPLPEGLDLAGAARRSRDVGAREVQSVLELFLTHQDTIREVREAWESIPLADFHNEDDRWRTTMVREGVFRDLARCRTSGGDVQAFFARVRTRKAVHDLPSYRAVLRRWAEQLARSTETGTEALKIPRKGTNEGFPAAVAPDYFETQRLEWRGFIEHDNAESGLVVIVNKTLTEQTWSGKRALGKRLRAYSTQTRRTAEVIEVVQDRILGEVLRPVVLYRLIAQSTYTARELDSAHGAGGTRVAPKIHRMVEAPSKA